MYSSHKQEKVLQAKGVDQMLRTATRNITSESHIYKRAYFKIKKETYKKNKKIYSATKQIKDDTDKFTLRLKNKLARRIAKHRKTTKIRTDEIAKTQVHY